MVKLKLIAQYLEYYLFIQNLTVCLMIYTRNLFITYKIKLAQ
jgi:hypothetical protein